MGSEQCWEMVHTLDSAEVDTTSVQLTEKKHFDTCVACGPEYRAYGYCIVCMELLCAECVRAHKQVGLTTGHNIATIRQHAYKNKERCDVAICDYCGPQVRAMAHCAECYEFLCEYCVRDHQRVIMTKGHEIIDIQLFSIPSETPRKFICESHNKIGLCTCDTCEATVLCHQCLPAHHKHLLRKPHNFQVFLPSLATCFRERDTKIDKFIDDVKFQREFTDRDVKTDRKWMKEHVYNKREATKKDKQDYKRKFIELKEKRYGALDRNTAEVALCKQKSVEILDSYDNIDTDDTNDLEILYDKLLQTLSETIPSFDSDENKELSIFLLRRDFENTLKKKIPDGNRWRSRYPKEESSESEEEQDSDDDPTAYRYPKRDFESYDSDTDRELTKQEIEVKYTDIFTDHETKDWRSMLKEAELMINIGYGDCERIGSRKAWSAMALSIRIMLAKIGISVVSPYGVQRILKSLNQDTHFIGFYIEKEPDYFGTDTIDTTCKFMYMLANYFENFEMTKTYFDDVIFEHKEFQRLISGEGDYEVVLSGVKYQCHYEVY